MSVPTFLPVNTKTVYLPVTQTFPEDAKSLREKLNYIYTMIANATNLKDIAQYDLVEVLNGHQFFTPNNNQTKRQVFRLVVNFGTLPNTGTKSVPHGISITAATIFTRIYATATAPSTSFIPIPYAGTNPIEINVDPTNVNITTTSNRSAFTICYVILEYIKG